MPPVEIGNRAPRTGIVLKESNQGVESGDTVTCFKKCTFPKCYDVFIVANKRFRDIFLDAATKTYFNPCDRQFQATSPLASVFIALQHNVTDPSQYPTLYSPGMKDWAGIFFYSLICIVVHAIIQEYFLDVTKSARRSARNRDTVNVSENVQEISPFQVETGGVHDQRTTGNILLVVDGVGYRYNHQGAVHTRRTEHIS